MLLTSEGRRRSARDKASSVKHWAPAQPWEEPEGRQLPSPALSDAHPLALTHKKREDTACFLFSWVNAVNHWEWQCRMGLFQVTEYSQSKSILERERNSSCTILKKTIQPYSKTAASGSCSSPDINGINTLADEFLLKHQNNRARKLEHKWLHHGAKIRRKSTHFQTKKILLK